jgi:Ner family transcriptional regulator
MAHDPKGMHPEDIKAALRRRYGTMRALSAIWKQHPSAISRVLLDPRYSIPTERLIAKALDKPPHEIWPERWSDNGERLLPRGDKHRSGNETPITSQKRRAA